MCVAEWSAKGFVKDKDIKAAVTLPEVNDNEELELGCDAIVTDI
jgi:hypothetical protein